MAEQPMGAGDVGVDWGTLAFGRRGRARFDYLPAEISSNSVAGKRPSRRRRRAIGNGCDRKVMTEASKLSKGQAVKFSGTFIRGDVDCVRESSVAISGSMKSPDFILRFSDIERVGDLYVQPNSEKKSWLRSLF